MKEIIVGITLCILASLCLMFTLDIKDLQTDISDLRIEIAELKVEVEK